MSKRNSDHDDGGANTAKPTMRPRGAKSARARRSFAKDRGEAFVVFLGSMLSPGRTLSRTVLTRRLGQDIARALDAWPVPVKIKRIKV